MTYPSWSSAPETLDLLPDQLARASSSGIRFDTVHRRADSSTFPVEVRGDVISIVAVTGCGQEEDRRRSTRAGVDAHLVKPVDPEMLVKVVRDARPGASPA